MWNESAHEKGFGVLVVGTNFFLVSAYELVNFLHFL